MRTSGERRVSRYSTRSGTPVEPGIGLYSTSTAVSEGVSQRSNRAAEPSAVLPTRRAGDRDRSVPPRFLQFSAAVHRHLPS